MYPRVKVRALDDDDDDCSKHPLGAFNSLSIRDSTLPVKEVKHTSSVSVAKVPKSYVPRSITPPTVPKSANNNKVESDDKNHRIRATSIPRPRAVISSPDNDQILASENRMRLRRPSALKNHDLVKGRQPEQTCTPANTTNFRNLSKTGVEKVAKAKACTRTSTATNKLSNNGGCKVTDATDVKAHKGPSLDIRVPTVRISKGKPCFMVT